MTYVNTHRRAAGTSRDTLSSHPQQNSDATSASADSVVDTYVLARIDFRARRLAIQFGLSDERRDDIRHDMVVEVLQAAERFDPSGVASWRTYASRVLDIAVKKLVQYECRMRHREAGKPRHPAEAPDGCATVDNPIDEGVDDLAQLELKLDIEVVMERMPERLQEACRLLRTLSPAETAEVMGMHPKSIYRVIARIREHFEAAGFAPEDLSATDSA